MISFPEIITKSQNNKMMATKVDKNHDYDYSFYSVGIIETTAI